MILNLQIVIVQLDIAGDHEKMDVTVTGVQSVGGEKQTLFTQAISISRTEHVNVTTNSIFRWPNLISWLRSQGISSLAVANLVVSQLTASILTVAMSPTISKLSLEQRIYGSSITTSTALLTFEQQENARMKMNPTSHSN